MMGEGYPGNLEDYFSESVLRIFPARRHLLTLSPLNRWSRKPLPGCGEGVHDADAPGGENRQGMARLVVDERECERHAEKGEPQERDSGQCWLDRLVPPPRTRHEI